MTLILRLILQVSGYLNRDRLGSAGFYPIPGFLRAYFARLPKNRQVLVYSRLVKDVSFWKKAPPELACAESVTSVLNVLFGFPIITGTWTLLQHFLSEPSMWIELDSPIDGCVVIAATGTGNGSFPGHVGTYDNGRVWSNNSLTGRWGNYWSMTIFKAHYQLKGGMKVRYFFPK